MNPGEFRIAQAYAMAEPERLRLLARLLTCPAGQSAAEDLAGQGLSATRALAHLQAMSDVGVVAPVGRGAYAVARPPDDDEIGALYDGPLYGPPSVRPDQQRYRVAPRGIVGFGVTALAAPRFDGDPALDPGNTPALLSRITETLAAQFSGSVGPETVERLVRESHGMLTPTIGTAAHLPAVTAWLATDRLAALTMHALPRRAQDVLVVCVHNQGRSQIAAAVLRHLAGDRLRVRTAGSRPASAPDATVRSVLARRGLDGLVEFPRPLTPELVRASGVIVTMGCGDACPVLPGRRYLDWPVDDPSGRTPAEVERIVDDVTARVQSLVEELDSMTGLPLTATRSVGVFGDEDEDGLRVLRAVT
ncbi:low molecular weight phosphatase family protein [Antribacter gilvus]|uniref:arsenate-mycothiol transferase ArsC n=1 Tax=Antribacter gilvus TaxID=2304675 RepID=UPI00197D5AEC|nr:low molecular weight phosphatase family protein [Antribacter gilvus]